MSNKSAILVVPNTIEGFATLKYLASEIAKHEIFVKLVSKKEFDLITKNTKEI